MSGTKSRIIIKSAFAIDDHYKVILYVIEVPENPSFPSGIKAKFALIHTEGNYIRLLVDNHEPFGFHIHTQLPADKNVRIQLLVSDYKEALKLFRQEVERIIRNEKK